MVLKLFFDISISFGFSKISVECTLHSEAPPCINMALSSARERKILKTKTCCPKSLTSLPTDRDHGGHQCITKEIVRIYPFKFKLKCIIRKHWTPWGRKQNHLRRTWVDWTWSVFTSNVSIGVSFLNFPRYLLWPFSTHFFISEDILHSFSFYFFQNFSNQLLFTHCCCYSKESENLDCDVMHKLVCLLTSWMVFHLEPTFCITIIRLKMNQDLIAWRDKVGRNWITTILSHHGWCT